MRAPFFSERPPFAKGFEIVQFKHRRHGTPPARRLIGTAAGILGAGLLLSACDDLVGDAGKALSKAPDYRPQDAGTVDHALCLLGFSAVPLTHIVTGHHLVDATVNGTPARFVVDTGANISVIDSATAGDFDLEEAGGGLPSIPIPAVSIAGAGQAQQMRLDSMTVGGMPVRQSTIMVADLGALSQVLGPLSGGRLDGLIGQDLLDEHRAVIDVARPMLYMIAADQDPAPVAAEDCGAVSAPASPPSPADE